MRTLVETGALVGERGAYRLVQDLTTMHMPPTVQAVLAARIDRLPPEEKRLLQTAAVIGKDVPFALLQAIAELPEDTLRLGLTHLQAAEFLYETSLFPELEYTFKHALTHEVAYGSQLHERRRGAACPHCGGDGTALCRAPGRGSRTVGASCPARRGVGEGAPSTAGRLGQRRWHVRPIGRRWRTLSRRWKPSRISPTVVRDASRPSICA